MDWRRTRPGTGLRSKGAACTRFPTSSLRSHRHLRRPALIRPETQQGCNVADRVELRIVLHIKQFNVAPNRDRNHRLANIFELAGCPPAYRAEWDEVRIDLSAAGALDRTRRIVFAEQQGLHFAHLQCA